MADIYIAMVMQYSTSVGGVTVSMVAFQAVDPGSIPGRRSFAELIAIKKSAFENHALSEPHNPKSMAYYIHPLKLVEAFTIIGGQSFLYCLEYRWCNNHCPIIDSFSPYPVSTFMRVHMKNWG